MRRLGEFLFGFSWWRRFSLPADAEPAFCRLGLGWLGLWFRFLNKFRLGRKFDRSHLVQIDKAMVTREEVIVSL